MGKYSHPLDAVARCTGGEGMIIQHLYNTAPKAVRDQVDALLGYGARSPSHDAGSPWPQPDVVDGPLWDQDDQASLVEGMRE
jgi:hypothetical protein